MYELSHVPVSEPWVDLPPGWVAPFRQGSVELAYQQGALWERDLCGEGPGAGADDLLACSSRRAERLLA